MNQLFKQHGIKRVTGIIRQSQLRLRRYATPLHLYTICLFLIPSSLLAEYQFPIGERATYKVQWGLLNCGTSTISCDEVEMDGKTLIRIRVRVKSSWLASTIYPVDDTVDCFIDPETQLSIRLEKDTSEGDYNCKDILEIDRENNMAYWTSHTENITTNYSIEAGSCDAVSFLYDFRKHTFGKDASRTFNIVVDAALHGITVTARSTDEKKVGEREKVRCRKYVVVPEREDLFVRKIPKEIWLTEDHRKILVRMDVELPIGKARIVLDEYIPPHQMDVVSIGVAHTAE